MWDSACDAIDAECKRLEPLVKQWAESATADLVHPTTLLGPGWQCPSFIVPLVCIKLGIPNDDAAPQKVAKWLTSHVKYNPDKLCPSLPPPTPECKRCGGLDVWLGT